MVNKTKVISPFPSTVVKTVCGLKAWERIARVHHMYQGHETKKGLLIYGDSGVGKTFLVKQYQALFPGEETPEKMTTPIFYYRFVEAKKSIDDILKFLILAFGSSIPRRKPQTGELHHQFVTLIKEHDVNVIILDEIQQVLPLKDGIRALDIIKYFCALLDELPVSIVFLGSERAKQLITFGAVNKTIDDNEQMSRRMMRSIKLEPILPKTDDWLECVNFFLEKINLEPFTYSDASLLNRIYLAYAERNFSTLESLFLLEKFGGNTKDELLPWLYDNYELYCQGEVNPFDQKLLSDIEVDIETDNIFAKYED